MRAITQPNVSAGSRVRPVKRRSRSGFTLIELLVVIALTAILLTVIFVPLVNSYALTSKADTQILAQSTARSTLSFLTNRLSNADFIYDNAVTTQVNGSGQTVTGSEINLWLVDSTGTQYTTPVSFAMLEAVTPARVLDQSPYTYDAGGNPIATPIDPTTNEPIYDPSLSPGLSGYQLPLAPGRVLTRIFVGLNNNAVASGTGLPIVPYSNQFEDVRATFNNRYTLYRAEVTAYIQDPTVANPTPSTPYVPNLGLFHTVNAGGVVTDNPSDTLRLHDPNFFYDNSPAGGSAGNSLNWAVKGWVDLNGDGVCEIWENWAALSTSLMPKNRVDMVALDRAADTNQIVYYDNNGQPITSGTGKPHARTLAVFKPTYVQNDIAVPTSLDNSGNETPNSLSATYMTQYAHWTRPYRVTVYRANGGADPVNQNPLEYYQAVGAYSGDTRIFHVTGLALGALPPPVPGAFLDVSPKFDPKTGAFTDLTSPFAFTVNADKGIVNFAFPSGVTVNSGASTTPAYVPLPQRYSPAAINGIDAPNYARRYIDLRAALPAVQNPAGAISPLSPTLPWYADVHMVPGSELVFGPDQLPGPHYGNRIRYTRVSSFASTVGPNQYRINYENNSNPAGQTDPALFLGYIEFQQGTDPNPAVTDNPAAGIFKSIVLPTQKLDFANPGNNLAADPVEVSYYFTMVRPNDVVKVDYMSRDLMNVALEVRLYDAHTGQPQIISLSDKIKVRNLQH
ncbi:MAG: prepilin-type N-terminal cleavage/methylation domain [Chthonomonadaceae bacterium]|nr:prepilin-type N-terminal cleavage/methylation domain [Chthonomonadaceae bacterium]